MTQTTTTTTEDRSDFSTHLSVGVVGAPLVLFPKDDLGIPYFAVSVLPEIRLAQELDQRDKWRVFAAFRWAKLTATVPADKEVNAVPSSKQPFMFAAGFSVRPVKQTSKNPISTSVERISFNAAYGAVPTDDKALILGLMLMVSVDADAVSFNF